MPRRGRGCALVGSRWRGRIGPSGRPQTAQSRRGLSSSSHDLPAPCGYLVIEDPSRVTPRCRAVWGGGGAAWRGPHRSARPRSRPSACAQVANSCKRSERERASAAACTAVYGVRSSYAATNGGQDSSRGEARPVLVRGLRLANTGRRTALCRYLTKPARYRLTRHPP